MRKSRFSKEDKLNILMEQDSDGKTVEEICVKYGISSPTFYSWKRELSNHVINDIHINNESELVKENHTLRRLYIELSEHNYQLAQFLNK